MCKPFRSQLCHIVGSSFISSTSLLLALLGSLSASMKASFGDSPGRTCHSLHPLCSTLGLLNLLRGRAVIWSDNFAQSLSLGCISSCIKFTVSWTFPILPGGFPKSG